MSNVEQTHRDKVLLRGWVFCPVSWDQVMVGDTILGSDGQTRYVVSIEKHYATAIVGVMHGNERQAGEKNLADAVHVLEDATGIRLADYEGTPTMRSRRTKK